MVLETHDEYDDEIDDRNITERYERRPQTPARVLQVKFIGFLNAAFNYIMWLIEQDRERRRGSD